MQNYLYKDVPIVAVYNNLESFYGFLSRATDPAVLQTRYYQGDHGLFWLGASKLLFVTSPIPQVEFICQRWGYNDTCVMTPEHPSHQLSLDILREPHLINRLIEYAGPGKIIQMVPYVTTLQFLSLAEALRKRYGLTVLLPESPDTDHLWLRDYFATKTGFQSLVSQWLASLRLVSKNTSNPALLPFGIACRDVQMATRVVNNFFIEQKKACAVKPDRGIGGLGQIILHPSEVFSSESIAGLLQQNPFWGDDLLMVEEFLFAENQNSPSLEFFVPALGRGEPVITNLARQILQGFGYFYGAVLSPDLLEAPWYPTLAESGLFIAKRLQEMGYVGHFDIDTIVDCAGRLYLLESNPRRTGSTYVHEFAQRTFGPDYLQKTILLSTKMSSGGITDATELLDLFSDLLYPCQHRGIIITTTSSLVLHEFGCIIVAKTTEEALTLQQVMLSRINSASKSEIPVQGELTNV